MSSLHKSVLLLEQVLLVNPQAGISGDPVLSNCVTKTLKSVLSLTGCAQRHLRNTEVQTESRLCAAIGDQGFLLDQPQGGRHKTRKDAEKADRVVQRYGVTFQIRKNE